MRWYLLVFAVLVAGCDSPSVGFLRGSVQVIDVDGSRFRVFTQHGSNKVEVHRVSVEMMPSLVLTLDKAFRAIELATSCQVVRGSLRGDRAIILAKVDCMLP